MAHIDGGDVATNFLDDNGKIIQITFSDLVAEFQVHSDFLKAQGAEIQQLQETIKAMGNVIEEQRKAIQALQAQVPLVANMSSRLDELEDEVASANANNGDRIEDLVRKVRVLNHKTQDLY